MATVEFTLSVCAPTRHSATTWLVAVLVVGALGCDSDPLRCESDADCFAGETCAQQNGVRRCVLDSDGGGSPTEDVSDSGTDTSDSRIADTGEFDTGIDTKQTPEDVDTGPRECSNQTGVCQGSISPDGSPCSADEYGPNYESDEITADDLDNDCDGLTDEVYEEVWGYWQIYCAQLVDGSAVCWGGGNFQASKVPDDAPKFQTVEPGKFATCGHRTDGRINCWGSNSQGLLDYPDESFSTIAVGTDVGCGVVRSSGNITCWGDNSDNQISDVPDRTATDLANGWTFSCGLDAPGQAFCWGQGTASREEPSAEFEDIAAGQLHACGRTTGGEAVCWGDDSDGKASPPVGTTFEEVAAGYHVSCGITKAGPIECWGRDIGEPPDGSFESIAAGYENGCAVRADGRIECWGIDDSGELDPP